LRELPCHPGIASRDQGEHDETETEAQVTVVERLRMLEAELAEANQYEWVGMAVSIRVDVEACARLLRDSDTMCVADAIRDMYEAAALLAAPEGADAT
jgi:hypothetical protein